VSARSRFRWTLLAATIAHAAWLAWAGRGGAAQVAGRAEVRDSAHVEETEVDVEPAPAAAARPVSPPKEESAGPVAVAPLDARRGATAANATAAAAAGSGSSTGSLEPAPPDSSADRGADRGGWAFSPRVDGALASGGSLSAAPDAGVGMRDVLARGDASGAPGGGALPSVTPRDVDLGLAQGGPFVAMARDRVRRSLVPTTSHGVFEFTTDAPM
jgi:hypothetical protein